MPAAYLAQSGAIETSRSAGNIYFVIIANLKMALTLREQARLQRTIAKFYPVIMPFCIRPGRI
jgi:hypothetical protein